MSAKFNIVSEDVYNRSQSWNFVGVYRTANPKLVRVEIRANAYEDQSHATISEWGPNGWNFHASVPTQDWYSEMPSYVVRSVRAADFLAVRDELLRRYAEAMWNAAGPRPAVQIEVA